MIDSDTLELSFGFLLEKLYVVVEALPKKMKQKKNPKEQTTNGNKNRVQVLVSVHFLRRWEGQQLFLKEFSCFGTDVFFQLKTYFMKDIKHSLLYNT